MEETAVQIGKFIDIDHEGRVYRRANWALAQGIKF